MRGRGGLLKDGYRNPGVTMGRNRNSRAARAWSLEVKRQSMDMYELKSRSSWAELS